MCTALENLKQEGILEGRQEGILETVTLLQKLKLDDNDILQNLVETYHITEGEARSLLG